MGSLKRTLFQLLVQDVPLLDKYFYRTTIHHWNTQPDSFSITFITHHQKHSFGFTMCPQYDPEFMPIEQEWCLMHHDFAFEDVYEKDNFMLHFTCKNVWNVKFVGTDFFSDNDHVCFVLLIVLSCYNMQTLELDSQLSSFVFFLLHCALKWQNDK